MADSCQEARGPPEAHEPNEPSSTGPRPGSLPPDRWPFMVFFDPRAGRSTGGRKQGLKTRFASVAIRVTGQRKLGVEPRS